MWMRYLGSVLLALLPVHDAAQPCAPPVLDGGYFIPELDTYPHEKTLTYACNGNHKPVVVEGWWATSRCLNGNWSPKPQCIAGTSCSPPTIPNGKYADNQRGWYEDSEWITITCNTGYQMKLRSATSHCNNGEWSSLPVCEKSISSCYEPPRIPHGVIINQRPQEVYPDDSRLQFECEENYNTNQPNTEKYITCREGQWAERPLCILSVACVINTAPYYSSGQQIINLAEGETKMISCQGGDTDIYVTLVRCTNRKAFWSHCCERTVNQKGTCRFSVWPYSYLRPLD